MKMHELPLPAGIQWGEAENGDALAQKLAARITGWLEAALAERPRASLALSGGSTPIPLFEALSQAALPWGRVDVTLVDERWVTPDHKDSNERLIRNHLLQGAAREARLIPLKVDAPTARQGQSRCEAALATLDWPLDVVVLGMGNDGHTASLFPGADHLAEALAPETTQRCMAINPPEAPHARMTLTYAALASARHQVLHLVGHAKYETLGDALRAPDDVPAMPIRAFLKRGLSIFWSP